MPSYIQKMYQGLESRQKEHQQNVEKCRDVFQRYKDELKPASVGTQETDLDISKYVGQGLQIRQSLSHATDSRRKLKSRDCIEAENNKIKEQQELNQAYKHIKEYQRQLELLEEEHMRQQEESKVATTRAWQQYLWHINNLGPLTQEPMEPLSSDDDTSEDIWVADGQGGS